MSILLVVVVTAVARVHPEHESLAEVAWAPETGCLEVALRVDARHLEETLRPRAGHRVDLEMLGDDEAVLRAYVRQRFRVRPTGAAPFPLRWVGHELEGPDAWLYFEIDLRTARGPIELRNNVLFERLPRQINTVVMSAGARREALFFTVDDDGWKPVEVVEPAAARWALVYQVKQADGYQVILAETDGTGPRPLGPLLQDDPGLRATHDRSAVCVRTGPASALAFDASTAARAVDPDRVEGPGATGTCVVERRDGAVRLVIEHGARRVAGPWHATIDGPVWSPDGRHVAASVRDQNGVMRVALLDVRRGIELAVRANGPARDPAWSRDGRLAFAVNENGTWHAHVVDGPGAELLRFGPGRRPAWAGDGETLFVERVEGIVRLDATGDVIALVAPPGAQRPCVLDRREVEW